MTPYVSNGMKKNTLCFRVLMKWRRLLCLNCKPIIEYHQCINNSSCQIDSWSIGDSMIDDMILSLCHEPPS